MLEVTNMEWSSDLELLAKERIKKKMGMFAELLDYSKKRSFDEPSQETYATKGP